MKNLTSASRFPLKRQDRENYFESLKIPGLQVNAKNREIKIPERQLFIAFAIDILLLNLSILGSIKFSMINSGMAEFGSGSLFPFLVIINFIWFFVSTFTDVYEIFEGVKLNLRLKDLFWTTLISFGLISLAYYPFFYDRFQIHFLITSFLIYSGFSMAAHLILRHYFNQTTSMMTYAIVGGGPKVIKHLGEVFQASYGKEATCVGRFANNEIPNVPTLGGFHEIENFLQHHRVSKLLYFHSNHTRDELQYLIQLCRTHFIDFEVIPSSIDLFKKGVQVEQLQNLPVFRRKKEPLCLLKNRLLKRAFDIVFSFLVITLIFPWLFPIIALLIKIETNGPIFFSQFRSGYWNKPFKCYKFRSMVVNESSDKKQAIKNDIRITKIGAFLRKTNLDELPQFFNVFTGDMSIVGPRPHMLQHTDDYSKLIDSYMIRHEVKPGITGWAQVSGWRGPTTEVFKMIKRVEHDVFYIENWNFWFDCKCVWLTVFNMIRGEKNAF